MAIKDTSRKPYIEDNDENIFIGIDLPIRKGDDKQGYFASTKTTIEAVKNNIRNLLNTHQGERLMQPNLGINLRKHVFEQINPGMVAQIREDIDSVFRFWLPFVEIRRINIKTHTTDSTVSPQTMLIDIVFNITQDPNTLESVQVEVTSAGENPDAQTEL
jgi:phage baseplate assembly protein W|tara:strand:- start:170 stop:649 length:480 start_codon:yes stop_codon:yes gene_type:complete